MHAVQKEGDKFYLYSEDGNKSTEGYETFIEAQSARRAQEKEFNAMYRARGRRPRRRGWR